MDYSIVLCTLFCILVPFSNLCCYLHILFTGYVLVPHCLAVAEASALKSRQVLRSPHLEVSHTHQ
ncbi:hypothetical protein CPB83DRAFT_12376 [Crepidotus variabilis]|uniref:Uncharacterized protein n=1 Tax=Crepidotus variabilis TaxID=179855 RepID=A0A9P6JX45_9AGAR|nr:hypothetical protein CPB83DRAFT_12376 [Crepidotus variabilis]